MLQRVLGLFLYCPESRIKCRISIANTDSEAIALMDSAFDAAWRAVEEQTA